MRDPTRQLRGGTGGELFAWAAARARQDVDSRIEYAHLGRVWLGSALAISALLMVATAAHLVLEPQGLLGQILRGLDLRYENNVAAIWSGLLLALGSAHAFDGYARKRPYDRGAALGWALIALLLLALSADEIGSLHERAHHLGLGPWLPLLPFALFMSGLLAHALFQLWRTRTPRLDLACLVVGFAFLGSVALQEYIEHTVAWTTSAQRMARALIEEGSELAGMLILLGVLARNTAGLVIPRPAGRATFEAARMLRVPLVLVAVMLAPVLAYFTAVLSDQQRGHPADWAAAVLFLAAMLAAGRDAIARGRWPGWPGRIFCLFCAFAIAALSLGPGHALALGSFDADLRLLVVGALASLACASCLFDRGGRLGRLYLTVAALVGIAASVAWTPASVFAVYAISQMFGLAAFVVASAPRAVGSDAPGRGPFAPPDS
jgi:hypothetical protein